ncbi:hypothetical protein SUGI_1107930 [Cryptomeria japonica]|nr:hypothetical protein SUGI_1107930 [Cryptomeria japonica]
MGANLARVPREDDGDGNDEDPNGFEGCVYSPFLCTTLVIFGRGSLFLPMYGEAILSLERGGGSDDGVSREDKVEDEDGETVGLHSPVLWWKEILRMGMF